MLHEVKFESFNERDTVYGWIYVPACEPKGIVQLIHGFGEHSRRYFHMIVRFMEAGYIVAADDHVGHGKTALENDTWGNWGDKGCHTMMEDEHRMKKIACEIYPNLPYFLYGHSMGSMIARDFMTKYRMKPSQRLTAFWQKERAMTAIRTLEVSFWDGCASAAEKSSSEMSGSAMTRMFSRIMQRIRLTHLPSRRQTAQ